MKSIKIMLLGISLILVSIYIPHEPAFKTGGSEIFLVIIGFALILIGFYKKEE